MRRHHCKVARRPAGRSPARRRLRRRRRRHQPATRADRGQRRRPPPDGPAISIGAQDFGESAILAEIYAGRSTTRATTSASRSSAASATCCSGRSSRATSTWRPTTWPPSSSSSTTRRRGDQRRRRDARRSSNRCSRSSSLAAPRRRPRRSTPTPSSSRRRRPTTSGITTLSDLAEKGADLTLGAPPDCETNGFCIPGLQRVYGLDLSGELRAARPGVIPDVARRGRDRRRRAVLDRRAPRRSDTGWVLLEDDKGMLAADNVFPVASQELVDAYGDDLTSAARRHLGRAHHRGPDRAEQALRHRQGGRRGHRRRTGSPTTASAALTCSSVSAQVTAADLGADRRTPTGSGGHDVGSAPPLRCATG